MKVTHSAWDRGLLSDLVAVRVETSCGRTIKSLDAENDNPTCPDCSRSAQDSANMVNRIRESIRGGQ